VSEFGNNYLALIETKSFKIIARLLSGTITIALGAILIFAVLSAFTNIWWFSSFDYLKYLVKPHDFTIEGRKYSLPKDFYLVHMQSRNESEYEIYASNYSAWSIQAFIPKNNVEIDSALINFSNRVFWLWVHNSFSNRFNGEEAHYLYNIYNIDMYHDAFSGANYLTNVVYYIQISNLGMRFIVYCNKTDDTRVLALIQPIAFPSTNGNFQLIKNETPYDATKDHL
jgi:hypothetical protein